MTAALLDRDDPPPNTLTTKDLLAAGFKGFPPDSLLTCDELYQLRVRDDQGTRYFINCLVWRRMDRQAAWEIQLHYNDGCPELHPGRAAIHITAFSGVERWTVAEVLRWADELWTRLRPAYYEKDDAS